MSPWKEKHDVNNDGWMSYSNYYVAYASIQSYWTIRLCERFLLCYGWGESPNQLSHLEIKRKNHNQTCWCFFVLFYSPSHTSRLFTLFNIYYGLDLDIASIVANQTATFNNSDRSSTLVDLCLLNNLHFFDRQNDPPQLISTFLIIFN